ncbi:MAG: polyprenol monophosphomannose synthase [Leptospirales bacterium]
MMPTIDSEPGSTGAPVFTGPSHPPEEPLALLMIIPTYNESENIVSLIDRILCLSPRYGVLVVDDHSPDRTWEIIEQYQKTRKGYVFLLHRFRDRGRGPSGIEGFQKALQMGVPFIGEMDADGSHAPDDIPGLMNGIEGYDGVIGSRLVPGGREEGRPYSRTLLTRGANLYIRTILSMPYRDITSGFRIFRREILAAIPWDHLVSRGPSVLQEILYILHLKGFRLREVPITFRDRILGTSTLNGKILRDSLKKMILFRASYRSGNLP